MDVSLIIAVFIVFLCFFIPASPSLLAYFSRAREKAKALRERRQIIKGKLADFKARDIYAAEWAYLEVIMESEHPVYWYHVEIKALGEIYKSRLADYYRVYKECRRMNKRSHSSINAAFAKLSDLEVKRDNLTEIFSVMLRMSSIALNMEMMRLIGYEAKVLKLYEHIKKCLIAWDKDPCLSQRQDEVSIVLSLVHDDLKKIRNEILNNPDEAKKNFPFYFETLSSLEELEKALTLNELR